MSGWQEMTLVLETIGELHRRGFGRLKLYCYVKEGLCAWRHNLFAADTFPSELPAQPCAWGSCPERPVVSGDSPQRAADELIARRPDLAAAAKGEDPLYTVWFAQLLAHLAQRDFRALLEMESPTEAYLGSSRYLTPYEGAR